MRKNLAYICLALALLCPFLGFALYSIYGSPFALSTQIEVSKNTLRKLDDFRQQIMKSPESSIERCQGLAQLGEIELRLNVPELAIKDWKEALNERFNPLLAFSLAELLTTREGFINSEAKQLYQEALNHDLKDEKIRIAIESRLAQAEHDEDRIKQEGFSTIQDKLN